MAGANYGWPELEGPSNIVAGITAPLFTYRHSDASPLGSGRAASSPASRSPAAASIRRTVRSPTGYRDQYYFADFVNKFVGRIDSANGNAAYAFARLSGSPVDLLVGIDGAVYVLTRGGVTRISAP